MSVIVITKLSVSYTSKKVLDQIDLQVETGETVVIRGESGSGKTTLGKAIANFKKHQESIRVSLDQNERLSPEVLFVENWYRFTNLEGDRNFYYQQRYNHQQKRDTISVAKELKLFGDAHYLDPSFLLRLVAAFDYAAVLEEQLIELSSGEHKKLQLIKALWLSPQVLIMDQPYTGLDKQSRTHLNQLFTDYTQKGGTLLLISNDAELPACAQRFVTLRNGTLLQGDATGGLPRRPLKPLPAFLKEKPEYTTQQIVNMHHVHVRYDEKIILDQIDWVVNAGEKWLLQGHNGSGKSTLLSLITGDHPQAYGNDIKLFGIQRGAGGESIWDIKRRIGLISPELHWYFDANATVLESLASGFFDSNGLYRQLRYAQKQQLDALLKFLDLFEEKDELLSVLPLGKQRLALLGRTIIKNPQLLVLDEPCQGLDHRQTQYFNGLVDEISKNGVTIIYVGHFETQLPNCLTHKLVLDHGKAISNTAL
ncbi:ATP-binding cassette domain-containing protein [Niabella insulamsoli]|uniref:ATP-binding cassette domain-containing protein n=1 Tax=Niabella insulamsoli TaxID=3144874 RepID=UPI0031FCCF01